MKSKLDHEIEQQRRVLQDKQAAYDEAKATTMPLLKEVESLDVSAKHKDKIARANVLGKSLKLQAEGVIAEQNKLLALQDSAIRDQLEKQHGLLAYGIATSGLGPEAQLLHATIGDYLNAKTDADRDAAKRSASLLWKHGTIIKGEKPGASTSVLDEFEAIADPEHASAYYRQHEATIKAQMDARRDAANQP
jgi:hypothetical protein